MLDNAKKGFKEGQQVIIGVTEFEDNKEAEMIVASLRAMATDPDEAKRTVEGVFCPLIGRNCRMDCASWEKASIISNKEEKYIIVGHRCVSPMIRPYPIKTKKV